MDIMSVVFFAFSIIKNTWILGEIHCHNSKQFVINDYQATDNRDVS